MKTFVFLTVLMTFLKFCACNDCTDILMSDPDRYILGTDLFLLKSDTGDDKLNKNFISMAEALSYTVLEINDFSNNSLIATKNVSDCFPYVINLKVKTTDISSSHSFDNLVTVGSFELAQTNSVCTKVKYCNFKNIESSNGHSNIRNVNSANANDTKLSDCTVECKPISENFTAKVVSTNVMFLRELYQLIELLSEDYNPMEKEYWGQYVKDTQYNNKVIICTNVNINHSKLYEYQQQYTVVQNCQFENFDKSNVLAIIAPKPTDLMFTLSVPTIFYDVPKILPHNEYEYPNSMSVHENYYKHLTKAAMKLIELTNWRRVGIISDGTAYSVVFEELMTSALHEKNIAYDVRLCCDFELAIKDFHNAQARIIILNLNEEHAPAFVKMAVDLGANVTQFRYMWIWRGWPFQNDRETKELGEVYSLSLVPKALGDRVDHNSIVTANIHKSIAAFANYEYFHDSNEIIPNNDWYREITKQLRKNLNKDKSDSVVYLRKITPEGVEKMYTFTITNNEVTSQVHKAVKFSDLPASVNCAVRSNKFHQPCDDTNLLLLVLVVFACPVIMMLLTFFFTLPKHNEPYNHL